MIIPRFVDRFLGIPVNYPNMFNPHRHYRRMQVFYAPWWMKSTSRRIRNLIRK